MWPSPKVGQLVRTAWRALVESPANTETGAHRHEAASVGIDLPDLAASWAVQDQPDKHAAALFGQHERARVSTSAGVPIRPGRGSVRGNGWASRPGSRPSSRSPSTAHSSPAPWLGNGQRHQSVAGTGGAVAHLSDEGPILPRQIDAWDSSNARITASDSRGVGMPSPVTVAA